MSLNSLLIRPLLPSQRRPSRSAKAIMLGSLLSGVAAVSMLGTPHATAAETACGVCPPVSGQVRCDCDSCGRSGLLAQNPVYTTLDTVAGGIEKLLGLDHCGKAGCTTRACDGGCDSAPWMMDSEVSPHSSRHASPSQQGSARQHGAGVPQPIPAPPRNVEPMVPPPAPTPQLPSVPPLAPAPPQVTQPRTAPPKAEPAPAPLESPPTAIPPAAPEPTPPRAAPSNSAPSEAAPIESPPLMLPEPETETPDAPTEPAPKPKKEGSIFDALDDLEDLDDPFKEDAAQLMRQYGSIRPMLERATKAMTPPYQPVYPTPTRTIQVAETSDLAIGSGLKQAEQRIGPLRPVSHEESVQLRPMTSRRVLAPYRPSR